MLSGSSASSPGEPAKRYWSSNRYVASAQVCVDGCLREAHSQFTVQAVVIVSDSSFNLSRQVAIVTPFSAEVPEGAAPAFL
jgi:hypothetical protein